MKSYSKSEKRRRPTIRGIDSRSDNFDDVVEKQLNDDFKVHEYLNENPPDGKNTQQYIALFNKLLVKKMHKNKRKELLESSKAQFMSKLNNSMGEGEELGGCNVVDFYYTEEEYQAIKQESEIQQEIIQTKTEEEMEMKKILWKEITEKKKSLNLLKGDIGHMIARNESITVLESKVNKVSLVSENQLKRVSMALSKDWEEVEQRQGMQKKFHQKLKMIENGERKNLKKIKNSYIQAMKRKKQIHDKLGLIEHECASVDEYSDKEKQYQQKNVVTKEVYELLGNLCDLIGKSKEYWEIFKNKQCDIKTFSERLKSQFQSLYCMERERTQRSRLKSSTPILIKNFKKPEQRVESIDDIHQEALQDFVNCIIQEYDRITTDIFEKKKVYNTLVETLEELWVKMSVLDSKQESLFETFYEQERITLKDHNFSYAEYFAKSKNLEENVRAITQLLSFLRKKLQNFDHGGMNLISRLYSNCLFHQRIFSKVQKTEGEEIDKNSKNLKGKKGQLRLLTNESIPSFSNNLYETICENLKGWFEELKNKKTLTAGEKIRVLKPKLQKNDDDSLVETNKVLMVESEQEQEDLENKENKKNCVQNLQLTPTRQNYSHHGGSLSNVDSFTNSGLKNSQSVPHQLQAKRVVLLENIDQTYYKMIKETLEMEKQNTRKNYQFQKNFKRTKYSSQDELLEQKRFEATFSQLFKQSQDDKVKVYGKTQGSESKAWKTSNFSKTSPEKKKLVNSLYVDKSKTPKERLIMSKGKVQKIKNHETTPIKFPKQLKKNVFKSQQNLSPARAQTASFVKRCEQKRLSQKLKLFLHEI